MKLSLKTSSVHRWPKSIWFLLLLLLYIKIRRSFCILHTNWQLSREAERGGGERREQDRETQREMKTAVGLRQQNGKLKRLVEKCIEGKRKEKRREIRYKRKKGVGQTEKCRVREQNRKTKQTTTNWGTVKHHMQTISKYCKMSQVKKKNINLQSVEKYNKDFIFPLYCNYSLCVCLLITDPCSTEFRYFVKATETRYCFCFLYCYMWLIRKIQGNVTIRYPVLTLCVTSAGSVKAEMKVASQETAVTVSNSSYCVDCVSVSCECVLGVVRH